MLLAHSNTIRQVAGEVCTYFDATPEGIVAQLLVSDGERSRHNRKALLAPHFKCAGVALCTHPTVGAACVITLAGGYGPRPLTREADVCCYGGEKPTAEFREVLESVPVPQITDEVRGWVTQQPSPAITPSSPYPIFDCGVTIGEKWKQVAHRVVGLSRCPNVLFHLTRSASDPRVFSAFPCTLFYFHMLYPLFKAVHQLC